MTRNCVPNFEFPRETGIRKKGSGAVFKGANVDGVDLSIVSWLDNRVVNTMSTYVGSHPESMVKRFRKKWVYEGIFSLI